MMEGRRGWPFIVCGVAGIEVIFILDSLNANEMQMFHKAFSNIYAPLKR